MDFKELLKKIHSVNEVYGLPECYCLISDSGELMAVLPTLEKAMFFRKVFIKTFEQKVSPFIFVYCYGD